MRKIFLPLNSLIILFLLSTFSFGNIEAEIEEAHEEFKNAANEEERVAASERLSNLAIELNSVSEKKVRKLEDYRVTFEENEEAQREVLEEYEAESDSSDEDTTRTFEEFKADLAEKDESQKTDAEIAYEEANKRLEEARNEIEEEYADASEEEIRRIFTEIPDLNYAEQARLQQAISIKTECSNSWWSIFCKLSRGDPTEDLYSQRLENRINVETSEIEGYQEKNDIIVNGMREEINVLPGFEDFEGCDLPNSNCQEQIEQHCTEQACQEQVENAKELLNTAADNYLIPNSGLVRAVDFIDVSPQSFAAADMIQDLVGFELSLISSGSALDDILNFGTPEQVCYAKVDSFLSVNGAEVEGKESTVSDENTGMTSRIKACDNEEFEICADLRAERSSMYFNNSFTLIVHFYVYNAKDYVQDVLVSAEFFDESRNRERVNILNISGEEIGNSIRLEPGERESMTIQIPEFQAFGGKSISKLYGNVKLGVYRRTEDNSGVFGKDNIIYALDYPIVEMGGESNSMTREERRDEINKSGVEAPGGTTRPSADLIDRVSFS